MTKNNAFHGLTALALISFGFFGSLSHLFTFGLVTLIAFYALLDYKNFKPGFSKILLYLLLTSVFYLFLSPKSFYNLFGQIKPIFYSFCFFFTKTLVSIFLFLLLKLDSSTSSASFYKFKLLDFKCPQTVKHRLMGKTRRYACKSKALLLKLGQTVRCKAYSFNHF